MSEDFGYDIKPRKPKKPKPQPITYTPPSKDDEEKIMESFNGG